jgi:hypothetical protein
MLQTGSSVGGAMRHRLGLTVAALSVLALLGVAACTARSPFARSAPPPPPSEPLPMSAFAVRFTPAEGQACSPTEASGIKAYRIVLHLFDRPPQVQRDERPSRPYVMIGRLQFGENWYTNKNLTELTEKHVPEIGGDAVFTVSIHQSAAAVFAGAGFYYATYELEVIRYTDK